MTLTIRRSPEVDTSTVADRCVLYHRRTGEAIVLNPSASILWQELEQPKTRELLAQALCERFPEVTPEQALADVVVFVTEVEEAEVVECDTAPVEGEVAEKRE